MTFPPPLNAADDPSRLSRPPAEDCPDTNSAKVEAALPCLRHPGEKPAAHGETLEPSARQLLKLLNNDQRQRWSHGERPLVEDYLARYAHFQDAPELFDLIYEEYLLREQLGEAPTAEEYVQRFPQHGAKLEQQINLHRMLGSLAPRPRTLQARRLKSQQEAALWGTDAAGANAGNPLWPAIPGYEILGELGRGGMGVVYKARQIGLKRTVALKMILGGAFSDPEFRQRFHSEAEAIARMQHPNIVQIYAIGTVESPLGPQFAHPFFALEYVDGGDLGRWLKGRPQTPRQAAQLLSTLADAVHCAHTHGIVHRDLKPANVLMTQDGQPRIGDFGLAKTLNPADPNSGSLTQNGTLLGTPEYMSPEQAAGQADVGPAADVYALGVILYELLTGRRPFEGTTTIDTLDQVRVQEPLPPSQLQPKTPGDLETICLKCLRKEPNKRYPSAQELLEDLQRFLAGEPIQARPVGYRERAWRWTRRHPARAALLALVALVSFVGLPLVTALWINAENAHTAMKQAKDTAEQLHGAADQAHRTALQARDDAEKARDAAERLRRQAERREMHLAFHEGVQLCEQGRIDRGLLWLARSLELAAPLGDAALDRVIRVNLADWSALLTQARLRLKAPKALSGVVYHPQGDKLLVSGHYGMLLEVDARNGQQLGKRLTSLSFSKFVDVQSAAYSPDGKHILAGRVNGTFLVWDAHTGKALSDPLKHDLGDGCRVAYRSNGQQFATAGQQSAQVWDSATRQPLGPRLGHTDLVSHLMWSPDGTLLATGSHDAIKVWNATTFQQVGATLKLQDRLSLLRFCPDSKHLLIGCRDGVVQRWEARTGKPVGPALLHHGDPTAAAFSPDGRLVVIGTTRFTAHLWDVPRGNQIGPPLVVEERVIAVDFRPDGRQFVVGCYNGHVSCWDVPNLQALGPPISLDYPILEVQFGPKDKTLQVGTWVGIHLWSSPHQQERIHYTPARQRNRALAFSADGLLSAQVPWSRDAYVFSLPNPSAPPRKLSTEDNPVECLAFAPAGKELLTVQDPKQVTVSRWDLATGQVSKFCGPLPAPVCALAVSSAANVVAVGCRNRTVLLFDLATAQPLGEPLTHPHPVELLTVAQDGTTLAVACQDGVVFLWDLGQRRLRSSPLRHGSGVLRMAFSNDGKTLLTGGSDNQARLYSVATGLALGAAYVHANAVTAVAFSRDGQTLLTGCRDRQVQQWRGLMPPQTGALSQIKVLAEVLTGRTLAEGVLRTLDANEVRERRKQLSALGGAHLAPPPPVETVLDW